MNYAYRLVNLYTYHVCVVLYPVGTTIRYFRKCISVHLIGTTTFLRVITFVLQ